MPIKINTSSWEIKLYNYTHLSSVMLIKKGSMTAIEVIMITIGNELRTVDNVK